MYDFVVDNNYSLLHEMKNKNAFSNKDINLKNSCAIINQLLRKVVWLFRYLKYEP